MHHSPAPQGGHGGHYRVCPRPKETCVQPVPKPLNSDLYSVPAEYTMTPKSPVQIPLTKNAPKLLT